MPGDLGNFEAIPILDYSLLQTGRKAEFIDQLRNALINVGFLYLQNPPIDKVVFDAVLDYTPRLFDIAQEKKDKIRMANSPHFLGYSRLGSELTKGATDQREQFDFATRFECDWKPGAPDYHRLWGNAQWPDEQDLPGFKETFLKYLEQVERLSYEFNSLLAEAFGLSPAALSPFFDAPENMQHRAKIVKYPTVDSVTSNQGVGPHFDAGFLTFLLQASHHRGLQVQNTRGDWIDAPPLPNTFVVNIGKGLEAVTQGLARATSHRVLSPEPGSTPRYSIPFFQNITQDVKLGEHILQCKKHIYVHDDMY